MDALYKNIRLYCDILRKCSMPEVENWQEEDLDRAFHWADYFKKALERISKRASFVQKVDGKLKEIGRAQRLRLGSEELNFDSFRQSSEYLVQALLENSHLPAQLRERILVKVTATLDTTGASSKVLQTEPLTRKKDYSSHYKTKDCETTKNSQLPLNTLISGPHTSIIDSADELPSVDLSSLLGYIEQLLSHRQRGAGRSTLLPVVCQRLDAFSKLDGAMDIIFQSLIELPSSDTTNKYSNIQKAILHWLLEKGKRDSDGSNFIWLYSPKTLALVSSQHLEFFKVHMKFLTKEMEKVETIFVGPIAMKQSEDKGLHSENDSMKMVTTELDRRKESIFKSETESLDKVVTHFVELCKTNNDVKAVCLSLVKDRALRHTGDGRFTHLSARCTCAWFRVLCNINKTLLLE